MSKSSHGSVVRDRVWYLLKAIIDFANGEVDVEDSLHLDTKITWQDKDRHTQIIVANRVTKHDLVRLTRLADAKHGLSDRQVWESLEELKDFLAPIKIFRDNRVVKQGGKGDWHFTLNLWFQYPSDERRAEFNQRWEDCRPNGAILQTPQRRAAESSSTPNADALLSDQISGPLKPAGDNQDRPANYPAWSCGVVPTPARIFLSYKRDIWPDEQVALDIYEALSLEHRVFMDKEMLVGTRWVERIAQEIQEAHVLIVLLSQAAAQSEMVQREIELARQAQAERIQKTGKTPPRPSPSQWEGVPVLPLSKVELEGVSQPLPLILPVRLAYTEPFPYPLSEYLNPLHWAMWQSATDTAQLIGELKKALAGETLPLDTDTAQQKITEAINANDSKEWSYPTPSAQPVGSSMGRDNARTLSAAELEKPDQGTMRLQSQFYISRPEDTIALNAIKQPGVTITIKGARQMGKSSLLIWVMDAAQQAGKQVAFLDFQLFDQTALQDSDAFFQQFCLFLTDELDLDDCVADYWQRPQESNKQRCTRYVRKHILRQLDQPLVLAMDEVESIFGTPFRTDFFGMLRSWHNQRANSPLWQKLDLTLVTSTEPYQLIDNLNQSPFNVGEVLELDDFSLEQVTRLNQCHGSPLSSSQVEQLMELVHGHPYLVRRALYLVACHQLEVTELFGRATEDRGPFGDHLRYHLFRLYDKPELVQALLRVIRNQTCGNERIFFRLRGAGLVRRHKLSRDTMVIPRCPLYADYFQEHLRG